MFSSDAQVPYHKNITCGALKRSYQTAGPRAQKARIPGFKGSRFQGFRVHKPGFEGSGSEARVTRALQSRDCTEPRDNHS